MSTDRSRTLLGLIIVILGIIFLLNNMKITEINVFPYWPVLLIIWGLNALIGGSRNPGAQGMSLFVILLGFVLLANSLGWIAINIKMMAGMIFPILIILLGISLFFGRSFTGKTNMAFLGGVERGKNAPWNLESGSYFAFMGGIELDLRHAVIPEGETILDLTAVMGGIEIRVPGNLPIEADGFAILGGVEFFGKGSGGVIGSTRNSQLVEGVDNRVLKIQSRAIMGGIDIKRV
jgi:predicted membrane protein